MIGEHQRLPEVQQRVRVVRHRERERVQRIGGQRPVAQRVEKQQQLRGREAARSWRRRKPRDAAHARDQIGMLAVELRFEFDRLRDRIDARIDGADMRGIGFARLMDRDVEARALLAA